VISRLKVGWSKEYEVWRARKLGEERWVYVWADGIYSSLRAEETRLYLLVIIGINERGQKRFLAIEDGVRESTESWRAVSSDLKRRGVKAPKLGVGDGALGFWGALEDVFPETRHQRYWIHKSANVLNYLPKAAQPRAKSISILHEIWMAETRADAERAFERFLKLAMSAEKSWRRLRRFQYLADVMRGVKFVDGMRQEKQNHVKPRLQQVAAWSTRHTPDLTIARR